MHEHDPVSKAIASVKRRAQQRGIVLHDSFGRELENYSLHMGVRDLPDDQLNFVLEAIGEGALLEPTLRTSGSKGGGHIRNVLVEWCNDPFSDCLNAAMRILDTHATSPVDAAQQLMDMTGETNFEPG